MSNVTLARLKTTLLAAQCCAVRMVLPLTRPAKRRIYQLLTSLLACLAGLSALAEEIPCHDLTVTVGADVTVETNAESGGLVVSWGRPDSHCPSLYLDPLPDAQLLAKTNAQTRIAQLAAISAWGQMQVFKGLPTLQRLTAATNEVALGSWKVTEVLVTARYQDRVFGTMNYACWYWAAGLKIWKAELLDGTEQHIARARQIIAKIKLKPNKPPATPVGTQSADPPNPSRKGVKPREPR